jgi:hypothetical protein
VVNCSGNFKDLLASESLTVSAFDGIVLSSSFQVKYFAGITLLWLKLTMRPSSRQA